MRFLVALGLVFFFLAPLPAQAGLTLKSVKLYDQPERAHLHLIFDQDYNLQTSFMIESGWMQVILPKADYPKEVSHLRVNDGFLKALVLKKEGPNTILEIQFSDPEFRAEGLVQDQAEFESYHLWIYKNAAALPKEATATDLKQTKPAEKARLFWGEKKPEPPAEDISFDSVIQMLLALFFVLLLFYILLLLYNKYFVRRLNLNRGKYRLRVTSNYHISAKQKISIVEVNDMAFAVGVTPNQISVISKVSDDGFVNHLSKLNLKGQETVDFARLREEYSSQRKAEEREKPPESFTHEFIKKVKNLKPID